VAVVSRTLRDVRAGVATAAGGLVILCPGRLYAESPGPAGP